MKLICVGQRQGKVKKKNQRKSNYENEYNLKMDIEMFSSFIWGKKQSSDKIREKKQYNIKSQLKCLFKFYN